ncbi:MAG: DUF1297 domain-containing protein [Candidatus Micrarchaeota archaeon]
MKNSISTIGSHSALEVSEGARSEGFRTIVACQQGRENVYLGYYKTRKRGKEEVGVIDEVLLMPKFANIVEDKYQKYLLDRNAIFIPNRSFSVYVGYDNIEKKFHVPIFGNKYLLRAEERDQPNNQYDLMKKAGMNYPREISSPEKINAPCIVKVNEKQRKYERAFFVATSPDEYEKKSQHLLKDDKITEEDLKKAKIEEFIIGAPFNFNFFYSKVHEELELMGVDMRRQTNLDGYLHLPADIQLELLKTREPRNIEAGHIACTVRESLLQNVFEQAEKLVKSAEKQYKPGIIGPFALQGAIEERDGKERFVTFDISFRIPGSPGTRFTPYSGYIFGETMSFGRRIAKEIKEAKKIDQITS